MRLISQNGEFDIPYEITSLSRTGDIIRAYVPVISEKGTVMAAYSTEEKANKVMEMLHRGKHDAVTHDNVSSFRFPKDDEV